MLVVLHKNPGSSSGGIESEFGYLLKEFERVPDLDITVAFTTNHRICKGEKNYKIVPVYLPSVFHSRYLLTMNKIIFNIELYRRFRNSQFDLININGENGVFLTKVRNSKTLLLLQGAPGLAFSRMRKIFGFPYSLAKYITSLTMQLLIDFAARRCTVIASVSQEATEYLSQRTGRKTIVKHFNGVDVNFFTVPDFRVRIRRIAGIDERRLTAIWVGRDPIRKGLDTAIASVLQLSTFQLLVVGSKSAISAPQLINYEDINDKFTLRMLYQSSDIFIFPSLSEGMSIALLEAMACGCIPVISSGAYVEGLTNNKNSFVANDVKEIIVLLQHISDNPQVMRTMSLAARESAERFSVKSSAERLFEIFKETILVK